MKNFHWGHKIGIVIISFIVIMLSMVYVTFQQTNEMEDTNYYEKELKYQNKIDAAQKLNAISSDKLLSQTDSGIIVKIPVDLITDFQNGTLEFLRSDDIKKDYNIKFQPNSTGLFRIEKNKFVYGFYKVRISWANGSEHYYREEMISIDI